MNNIRNFILAIIMMVLSFSASAEEYSFESSGLPLTKAGLRAYALTQVDTANFSAWSQSMIGETSERRSFTTREVMSSREWAREISARSIKLRISNSRPDQETIYFAIDLSSQSSGRKFFRANAEVQPIFEHDQWFLPRIHLNLWLVGEVPIVIDEVEGATIRLRNESGQVVQYIPLRNEGRTFYFPSHLAGSRGELIVVGGGEEKFFSLETGSMVEIEEIFVSATVGFDGVIYYDHPKYLAGVSVKTTNGRGKLPIIEVKAYPEEERLWPVVVYTTEHHMPIGYVVQHRNQGSGETTTEEYDVAEGQLTVIKIRSGLNTVIPVWGDEVVDYDTYIPEGREGGEKG